jgi:hypothetical protein
MAVKGIMVADDASGSNRLRRSADNPTAGDVFYFDGTELVSVPIGAAETHLTSNGTAPSWKVFLPQKAGRVLAASFTGNPKTATVTFSTAFGDANYAAVVTAVTSNGKVFTPNVETQLAGSFVINLGTNNKTDLIQVNWTATKDGETT